MNGDGETTRDFTYVQNVVLANELSLFTKKNSSLNEIYNIACGERISLNEILKMLKEHLKAEINVVYREFREGDIKHSLAAITKIKEGLGYKPVVYFSEGLSKTYNWINDDK